MVVSLRVVLVSNLLVMRATLRLLGFGLILIWLKLILIRIICIWLVIVILLHIRRGLLLLVLKIIISLILILKVLLLSEDLREIFKILEEIIGVKRHVRLIIDVYVVISRVLLEVYIGILLGLLGILLCCMHRLVDCTKDPVHEIGRNLLVILLEVILALSHFCSWSFYTVTLY